MPGTEYQEGPTYSWRSRGQERLLWGGNLQARMWRYEEQPAGQSGDVCRRAGVDREVKGTPAHIRRTKRKLHFLVLLHLSRFLRLAEPPSAFLPPHRLVLSITWDPVRYWNQVWQAELLPPPTMFSASSPITGVGLCYTVECRSTENSTFPGCLLCLEPHHLLWNGDGSPALPAPWGSGENLDVKVACGCQPHGWEGRLWGEYQVQSLLFLAVWLHTFLHHLCASGSLRVTRGR